MKAGGQRESLAAIPMREDSAVTSAVCHNPGGGLGTVTSPASRPRLDLCFLVGKLSHRGLPQWPELRGSSFMRVPFPQGLLARI